MLLCQNLVALHPRRPELVHGLNFNILHLCDQNLKMA